jgi:hypothetical protein
MEALLIHLDEELVNMREGRDYGLRYGIFQSPNYSSKDLAFWVQFYLLFYDEVFVPVNFLTDLKYMPEVFDLLRWDKRDSILRSDLRPLKISWDAIRFPQKKFPDLARAMINEADVSLRDPEATIETMRICEQALTYDAVIRFENDRVLAPQESVSQLKEEVFNPGNNELAVAQQGKIATQLGRCRECLAQIEERGKNMNRGYGRNFYYTIFGYGREGFQDPVAQQFSDITLEYLDVRNQFLCGVDYVSHRLKAQHASDSESFRLAGKILDVVMPMDYTDAILPNRKLWLAGNEAVGPTELSVKESDVCVIGKEAILGMTSQQLEALHKSDPFKEFKLRLAMLRNLPTGEEAQTARRNAVNCLQDALDAYLKRIRAELSPFRSTAERAITLVGRTIGEGLGLCVDFFLGPLQVTKQITPERIWKYRRRLEILPFSWERPMQRSIAPLDRFPLAFVDLASDVRLYVTPDRTGQNADGLSTPNK